MDLINIKKNSQQSNFSEERGRILLFAYAFPPMKVQMTAAIFKPMAALASLGYKIDVLCADCFSLELGLDESLVPFSENVFSEIVRLRPHPPRSVTEKALARIAPKIPNMAALLYTTPDLMADLHRPAYEQLMDMNLEKYQVVMTWSPFHSVNPVMVEVKKRRKKCKWIAQFSDPWVGNPLEVRFANKIWNLSKQHQTVKAANYIVHSSAYSLDLMLKNHSSKIRSKTTVIPHVFNDTLYPQRPKAKNNKIILRYLGVLYGKRTPEYLFRALNILFAKRKELKGMLTIEVIGGIPPEMLKTPAALSLPPDVIKVLQSIDYIKSLELMYDADILLLIEADVKQNLFLPSKLSDYLGANTPIVGLVGAGAAEDILKELGCWHSRPDDVNGIVQALEDAVDHVITRSGASWCNEDFRISFNGEEGAKQFIKIIEKIN